MGLSSITLALKTTRQVMQYQMVLETFKFLYHSMIHDILIDVPD